MQLSAPAGLCWKWYWVPTRKVPHFSRLKAVAETMVRFFSICYQVGSDGPKVAFSEISCPKEAKAD